MMDWMIKKLSFFFPGPERVNPVMPVSFIALPFGALIGEKVDEIASCLTSPYGFHVSLENGTYLTEYETSWEGIGTRMLHQLVRKDDGKL
jgi:hypothetical protein